MEFQKKIVLSVDNKPKYFYFEVSVIGRGNFAVVYIGEIFGDDSKNVAIRKIKKPTKFDHIKK